MPARVSVRYLDADGRPTDVIGSLLARDAELVVRTGDATVRIPAAAVVAVRELSAAPVRNSAIRAVEHAAAMAWPGTEQHWHRGWFLRAADGCTTRANSAVPLDFTATLADLPPVVEWYRSRGLTPWLAVPNRLLAIRAAGVKRSRVMVGEVAAVVGPGGDADLSGCPDAEWLDCYQRPVPVPVLSAVVDGEVVFARRGAAAVGRGAVTAAADGSRWLGISAVRTSDTHRRRGEASALCRALAAWGSARGVDRAYVQVLDDNTDAIALYAGLGFGLHHHLRYLDATALLPG